MVDHNHDRIKPRRRREVGDEVNGQLFKGEGDSGFDRQERRYNRVCVGLVLLAYRAASDKVLHEGGEAQPPEISFQYRFGTKNTHMTRQRGGMDRVEQGRVSRGGYEHMIVEVEMSVIKRPVREGGASEQGGTFVQGGECLKYKGI